MLFAETLTLKGSPPAIAYGLIKPHRSTKVVANAWRLKTRAARSVQQSVVPPVLFTPPKFVKEGEPTMEETMLASQEEKSRRRHNRVVLQKAALAEQRTAEDDIEPRLRAKLGDRPTSDIDRGVSWRRYRSTCYRSWKKRRMTQYQ